MSLQKEIKEPTAKEMKIFARQFTPNQYQRLVKFSEFVRNMTKDLKACQKFADNILKDEPRAKIDETSELIQ